MKNIFGIMLVLFLCLGCEEIEVANISDSDELERYVRDSFLGRDFFRTDNIILATPFVYPLDTHAIYSDKVDSVKRNMGVQISVDSSGKRIAEVIVTDNFYVTTTRTEAGISSAIKIRREFKRAGYFEKAGDDQQRFSGWLLKGFNGLNGVGLFGASSISHTGNDMFYNGGNYYKSIIANDNSTYILLTGSQTVIEEVNNGEVLTAKFLSTNYSSPKMLSVETDSGFIYQQVLPDSNLVQSTQFKTPVSHSNTWNIIVFNEFGVSDTAFYPPTFNYKVKMWCEPYRVE